MPFTYSNTQITKQQNVVVRNTNRFTIMIGGTAVGLLQDLRCQDDYSPEPASGIGDIHVKEYVPTMARHTISTSQACMFTASLRQLGISFENGDDALKGLVFDIEVHDRTPEESVHLGKSGVGDTAGLKLLDEGSSGVVLRRYEKCSFASGDIEIRKHAMVINSATINACNAVTPTGSFGPANRSAI